jgi:cobalamin-dependent methionine synthase I
LTRKYVEDDLKSLYQGTLFYARDAFAGLHTMDKVMSGDGHARKKKLRPRPPAPTETEMQPTTLKN